MQSLSRTSAILMQKEEAAQERLHEIRSATAAYDVNTWPSGVLPKIGAAVRRVPTFRVRA